MEIVLLLTIYRGIYRASRVANHRTAIVYKYTNKTIVHERSRFFPLTSDVGPALDFFFIVWGSERTYVFRVLGPVYMKVG